MKFQEPIETFRCVTSFTPTICTLIGARIPAQCQDTPIDSVIAEAEKVLGKGEKIEKALIFAPDACGIHLWERFPEKMPEVESLAPIRVPIKVVMPSVTPVCFASMYSGATPEVHGIREYAKPVLTVETIFNTFPESGFKTGISAVNGCSIDTIFRKRPITYISTESDAESMQFTKVMMDNPSYNVVLNYATNYDHFAHAVGPFGDLALNSFFTCIDYFRQCSEWVDTVWGDYNRLLVWCPDHGQHETSPGHGGHGSDMPEDMLVYHFYSIRKKGQK